MVALGVAMLLALTLPFAISAAKASARGKGRFAGATLAIGLAFATVFDPAKAAAVEETRKRNDAGKPVREDETGGSCQPRSDWPR